MKKYIPLFNRCIVDWIFVIKIEKENYTPSLVLTFEIANVFEVGMEAVFQYENKRRGL